MKGCEAISATNPPKHCKLVAGHEEAHNFEVETDLAKELAKTPVYIIAKVTRPPVYFEDHAISLSPEEMRAMVVCTIRGTQIDGANVLKFFAKLLNLIA